MDFGKIAITHIDSIQFKLPADHPKNAEILSGKQLSKPSIYIGASGWGMKEFAGVLYPRTLKSSQYLTHYSRSYKSVELSALFYGLPTPQQIRRWYDQTPLDFRFCPKFLQQITHTNKLSHVSEYLDQYLDCISGLGEKLGPILFMPHPSLGPTNQTQLLNFINSLPDWVNFHIELRHPDWFVGKHHEGFFDELQKRKRAALITDTAGRRDALHMHLTVPHVMVRFAGYNLHPTDYQRIDDWTDRLACWIENGLESVYFFIHQAEENLTPILIRYFIEQLNAKARLNLPQPILVSDQTLFG
jgi:uncharacterized protein YecE (DUF72 family)